MFLLFWIASKTAQEAPKRPQDPLKRLQEAAKRVPGGPKRPPRVPQEAPRGPPETPRAGQEGSLLRSPKSTYPKGLASNRGMKKGGRAAVMPLGASQSAARPGGAEPGVPDRQPKAEATSQISKS